MGILIDLVLIIIVILSAFLGYKKGLIELGVKMIAGVLAFVVALILFKPIGNLVINNTGFDEKIQNVIEEKSTEIIGDDSTENSSVVYQIGNQVVESQSRAISLSIIYSITGILLFIVAKLILGIVVALLDWVARLPILKQFNKLGGILYGVLRGGIIACICIVVIGVIAQLNPQGEVNKVLNESYIAKFVCENIVKI